MKNLNIVIITLIAALTGCDNEPPRYTQLESTVGTTAQAITIPPPKSVSTAQKPASAASAQKAPTLKTGSPFIDDPAWSTSVYVPTLPMPAAPRQPSTVKSLDWGDTFGYKDGQLVYNPLWGTKKSVHMGEQPVLLTYACADLIPATQHVRTIQVAAVANPSVLWETEYHRLVAIYGNKANTVGAGEVTAGVGNYLGQKQTELCAAASKKSVKDQLTDPSLPTIHLTNFVKSDPAAPFDVKVQSIRTVVPEELLRALALQGMPKPATKPVPAIVPVVHPPKPQSQTPVPPPAAAPCCCPACTPQK